MKLPFRQLPELPAGQGLVVGAPAAGGRTFFLSRFAREALEQHLRVCYIGYQDGNAWLWELMQLGHRELTFIDLAGSALDVPLLDEVLTRSAVADVVVVDNLDVMAYYVTGAHDPDGIRPMTPEGYLSSRLGALLRAAKASNTNVVAGITVPRSTPVPALPADADSWSWNALRVTPVVQEHQFAGIDNLTVVRLVKERP